MIPVLGLVFQHYLAIPIEQFTDKYIAAVGIIQLIENEVSEEDNKKIKDIESITDEKLYISFYALDRAVNPSKDAFVTNNEMTKFKRKDGTFIKLSAGEIQYYLCKAIREIHQIILKYMKGYKFEQNLGTMSADESKNTVLGGAFNV